MSLATRVAALATRIGQEIAAIHAADTGTITDSTAVFTPADGFTIYQFSARRSHGIAVITMGLDGPYDQTSRALIGSLKTGWHPSERVAGVITTQTPSGAAGSIVATSSGQVTASLSSTRANITIAYAVQ